MRKTYLPHIDGLRALAVSLVILYHLGLDLFKSGFIGVDIFFVFSGYLIINLIHHEIINGNFRFKIFITRRIKRLLPNLFVLLFATLCVGWFLLDTSALRELSQSIFATSVFSSNIFFQLKSDYFDVNAEMKPLLHTWSLSVEEQFYLVFPLFLFVLSKVKAWRHNKATFVLLILVIIVSFLLNLYLTYVMPTAAFYQTVSRAWEFAIGGLICVLPKTNSNSRRNAFLTNVGFSLILIGCLHIDETVSFSGALVLAPVIGTFLIIRHGHDGGLLGYFLTAKPIIYVGKISYSLYLWHFPVFVYLKLIFTDQFSSLVPLMGLLLTIIFSLLAFYLVEQPTRYAEKVKSNIWIGSAIALSLCVSIIGLYGHTSNGFQNIRYNERELAVIKTLQSSPFRQKCHTSVGTPVIELQPCIYKDSDYKVAVLGNSHGVELAYALAEEIRKRELGGLAHYTVSGCPPSYQVTNGSYCAKWHNHAISAIIRDAAIEYVIISYANKNSTNQQWAAYNKAVEDLRASGKKVVLIKQAPYLKRHPELSYLLTKGNSCELADQSLNDWRSTYKVQTDRYQQLENSSNIAIYDPATRFCDNGICYGMKSCKFLYYDKSHMSTFGASLLTTDIIQLISQFDQDVES